MLDTTIGANMINFSNAIAPQLETASAAASKTPLSTDKGFDQDQIAKLKDVCRVYNAQHIPAILFHLVAWGMSMLACCLVTAAEAEQSHEYKEATASTKHTQSIDDLLKRNRGHTVWPAANYMDLKFNIGTYCGLLWALFGDHCDYYHELLKIYHILDQEECFTICTAYT